MNAHIEIKDQFSILFSAPETITTDFLINIIRENLNVINIKKLPTFKVKFIKGYKDYCTQFASGQISYDNEKEPILSYLNSYEQPKWWLKSWNKKYLESVYQLNLSKK